MSDKSPTLTAKKRDRLGTRYAARVREAGGLPAVVYGHKEEPVSVSLDRRDAVSHINKGEKVFKLQLEGAAEQMVLLKDVQFDHLGSNIVHADFARVSLTDRVTVKVPIHLVGEAKGLKNAGAILMHPTSEVDVECLVTEIPEFLEVDISELDLDHAILASELKLPKSGMKLKTDKSAMLAQIVIQQEIVEEKPEEAVIEGAAATEPEVLTAKKPKEGEEGAEAAKPGAPGAKAPAAGAKPGAAPAKGAAPAAGAKPAAGGDKKK
jgi:large subunit ribosomal protein L25